MSPELYDTQKLKSCGDDVWISARASIRRPHLVTIGAHVAIDEFVVVTTGLTLGSHIHISPHVSVIGGERGLLTMGNFTAIAARGTIVCVSDQLLGFGLVTAPKIPEEYRDHSVSEPVTIRDFAVVGTNSVILPGVVIPEGAVIGACSLVRKSDRLKPWTIYAGNPLKEIAVRPKEKMLTYAAHLGFTQS